VSHSSPDGDRRRTPDPRLPVRAGRLLRVRAIWLAALVVGSLVVAAMTALYIASATDPLAHLSGLPVAVVNHDRGATVGGQRVDVGRQIEAGLLAAPAVTDRLRLETLTLSQAEQAMDRDGLYATLVIPPGFTANLLTATGLRPGVATSTPQVEILISQRAGSVGTSLATGILHPALAVASRQIGRHLAPLVPAASRAPATRLLLANPVTSCCGCSPGCARSASASGRSRCSALAGNYGQLIGLLVFVYAGLASAGGTVPVEALPGFLRALSYVEPLRQVLAGTRSILYFNAQGVAGLTRGTVAAAAGLAFWLVVGGFVVRWYDRKGFYRLRPEVLAHVDKAVKDYRTKQAAAPSEAPQPPAGETGPDGPQAPG